MEITLSPRSHTGKFLKQYLQRTAPDSRYWKSGVGTFLSAVFLEDVLTLIWRFLGDDGCSRQEVMARSAMEQGATPDATTKQVLQQPATDPRPIPDISHFRARFPIFQIALT
jgi:hypothetical protein